MGTENEDANISPQAALYRELKEHEFPQEGDHCTGDDGTKPVTRDFDRPLSRARAEWIKRGASHDWRYFRKIRIESEGWRYLDDGEVKPPGYEYRRSGASKWHHGWNYGEMVYVEQDRVPCRVRISSEPTYDAQGRVTPERKEYGLSPLRPFLSAWLRAHKESAKTFIVDRGEQFYPGDLVGTSATGKLVRMIDNPLSHPVGTVASRAERTDGSIIWVSPGVGACAKKTPEELGRGGWTRSFYTPEEPIIVDPNAHERAREPWDGERGVGIAAVRGIGISKPAPAPLATDDMSGDDIAADATPCGHGSMWWPEEGER